MQPFTETGILRPIFSATLSQPHYVTANGWRRLKKKVDQGIVYFVHVKEQFSGWPVVKKRDQSTIIFLCQYFCRHTSHCAP